MVLVDTCAFPNSHILVGMYECMSFVGKNKIKNTSLHSLISFLRIVVKDIQLIVCITLRGSQLKLWFVFIGLRLYVYTMLHHYFSV